LTQGAEFIVTFDADGQHRIDDVSKLLDALAALDADFALGSRALGQTANMPGSRRLLLWGATCLTRIATGLEVTDAHNGLRAMTRRGASHLKLRQNRMAHASEILDQIASSGLKYIEVPVNIEYSHYSLAKGQRSSDAIDILLDLCAGCSDDSPIDPDYIALWRAALRLARAQALADSRQVSRDDGHGRALSRLGAFSCHDGGGLGGRRSGCRPHHLCLGRNQPPGRSELAPQTTCATRVDHRIGTAYRNCERENEFARNAGVFSWQRAKGRIE
jgi:hypothetical protein